MKILRYEDIQAAINAQQLLTNTAQGSVQPASYDLRVGTIFRGGQIVNAAHPDRDRQFNIQPGELISIFTLEELNLPPNTVGFAFAMNQWSSQGLLILNPGHIDPGYIGPLTIKAVNLRKTPISLSLGLPIFTIVFFELDRATAHPYIRNQLDRRQKEMDFHAREQELTPRSVAHLLQFAPDLPTVSADAMDKAIRKHWITRWTLILAAVAAAPGVLALLKPDRSHERPLIAPSPVTPIRDSIIPPAPQRAVPRRTAPRHAPPARENDSLRTKPDTTNSVLPKN